jgi:hypothetical protein
VYLFVEFSDWLVEKRWEGFEEEEFGEGHDLPRSLVHWERLSDLGFLQGLNE